MGRWPGLARQARTHKRDDRAQFFRASGRRNPACRTRAADDVARHVRGPVRPARCRRRHASVPELGRSFNPRFAAIPRDLAHLRLHGTAVHRFRPACARRLRIRRRCHVPHACIDPVFAAADRAVGGIALLARHRYRFRLLPAQCGQRIPDERHVSSGPFVAAVREVLWRNAAPRRRRFHEGLLLGRQAQAGVRYGRGTRLRHPAAGRGCGGYRSAGPGARSGPARPRARMARRVFRVDLCAQPLPGVPLRLRRPVSRRRRPSVRDTYDRRSTRGLAGAPGTAICRARVP